MEPDFSGYVTKANVKCTDGRTIKPEAFQHMDGAKVPLVWHHGHNTPGNVLGHVLLHARPDGVYGEGFLNDTTNGKDMKIAVQHGDVDSLSIYANKLIEKSKQVFHGAIREVSLVLAGANPEAKIDYVRLAHADGDIEVLEDEAVIAFGEKLSHADGDDDDDNSKEDKTRTVQDVYDSLNEEQKNVVHHLIDEALTSDVAKHSEGNEPEEPSTEDKTPEGDLTHKEGTDNIMVTRVFEQNGNVKEGGVLSHDGLAEFARKVFTDAEDMGSFKKAYLAHADDYGVTNMELLFPDARNVDGRPEWITRKMEWVDSVLNAARKLPFTKIKSRSASLTHEEARAKGYIKGNMKKEQFFEIAYRETDAKTIYKKQKLDRDDIIDASDFDLVSWLWEEMRFMLREEIARAILVGDGRDFDDEDKIDPNKIRPIATDHDFYTHRVNVAVNIEPDALIEAILRSRKHYKGAGNPTMFTTEDTLTDMLLVKDGMGRRLYPTEAELKSALRVSNIVAVEVMENHTDENGNLLRAILVNMSDYSIGTNKGGEITTFDQFDIDFNQYKYLIEGRMSGALTSHKKAIAVWSGAGVSNGEAPVFGRGVVATPVEPDGTVVDGVATVSIPDVAGVDYKVDGVTVTGDYEGAAPVKVTTTAQPGYQLERGTTRTWTYSE